MSAFASSSHHAPCPRCNHTDGWCWTFTESGDIACRRDSTGTPRIDKNNVPYWVFAPDPNYMPPDPIDLPSPRPSSSVLTPDQQHQGYSALLPILWLKSHHRENLKARGLDHEDISLAGYRSLPETWERSHRIDQLTGGGLPVTLKMTFSEAAVILPNLAGFYWSEHVNPQARVMSDLRMGGAPGILVPIRDLAGRIRAYQTRVDEQHTRDQKGRALSKYRFFSDHRGPKPDYFCHVPAPHFRPADTSTVRLTEGPLKADVATAHGHVLTLGVPGVDYWTHFLPVLEQLRPTVVQVAWDMDAGRKLRVAETLLALVKELIDLEYTVELLFWDSLLGKGIDDLLAAGHVDELRCERGADALELAEAILAEANVNDPRAEEYRQAREEAKRHRAHDDEFDTSPEAMASFRAFLDSIAPRFVVSALPTPPEVESAIPAGPSVIRLALERAAREAARRAEQATPVHLDDHQTANALNAAFHNHDDFCCRCPGELGLEYTATGTPFTITKRCERRDYCRGCRLWYNHCRMLLLRRFVGELLDKGDKLYERYIPAEQWESLRHLINAHGCLYGKVSARCDGHVYVLTNDPGAGAEVPAEIALAEAAAILDDDREACGKAALVTFSRGWGENHLPKPDPKATFIGDVEWMPRATREAIIEQGDLIESTIVPQDVTDPVIRQRVYRKRGGWTEGSRAWFWSCMTTGTCMPEDYHGLFDSLVPQPAGCSTPWDDEPAPYPVASPPPTADWLPD